MTTMSTKLIHKHGNGNSRQNGMSGGHANDAYVEEEDDTNVKTTRNDLGTTHAPVVDDATSELKNNNKAWDIFIDEPNVETTSQDDQYWEKIYICAKVIFTSLLFVLVIGSAVVSKGALFLIIANIMPPHGMWNTSLKTAQYHLKYTKTETNVRWIWSLILVVIGPYILTLLASLRQLLLKKNKPIPSKLLVMLVLGEEAIHSVGLGMFVFALLPNLDPLTGVTICTNVVAMPCVLSMIFPVPPDTKRASDGTVKSPQTNSCLKAIFTTIALLASVASTAFWCIYVYTLNSEMETKYRISITIISVSPVIVSLGWWKTFVPQGDTISKGLPQIKFQLSTCRSKINAIVNAWKILITMTVAVVIFSADCKDGLSCLQTLFTMGDNSTNASLLSTEFGISNLVWDTDSGLCSTHLPLYVALVCILASIVCQRCCAAACKILAQIPGFSIPLVLVTPVTVASMFGLMVSYDNELLLYSGCYLPFPKWIGKVEFDWMMILAGVLGYVSLLMVAWHIWFPGNDRTLKEDSLFSQPLYCGVLLDQSMMLNRSKHKDHSSNVNRKKSSVLNTPFIYLCATMWHETEHEMKQLLMSILRVDNDQNDKTTNKENNSNDLYEFEAHIFFDDAYESGGDVNSYVKTLLGTVNQAKRLIYQSSEDNKKEVKDIGRPFHSKTPYGARLTWKLPRGNKLVAHLKDKTKIRHKKRWSQIMYIYYFLSHKLDTKRKGEEDDEIAKNTFLLALDGDVDFQPTALKLLVDKMKKNDNVGAACGRIHPIGSGPMVWYQKFEYAVSHWLQKATEHVVGCVLCSPGCFSLFRGSALMDVNVAKRYTTVPSKAIHHVQYDQGEDRWLCTLLLQTGWRVEYCAASDALTFAPEGFNEFYNQRRRWTPSTMANVMDLLLDWNNVRKINQDISMLFIAYQVLLMISSILTPGTIFLMVIGAINMAYPALSLTWTLMVNLIPVSIFIVLCFFANTKIQLGYAAILSTAYSLLMMLVVVGLLRQIVEYGFCSVTTIFLCFVAGVFVISAFLHPQEFWCIVHGFLYFLAIPSMSMLLMLYSLCNLHDVSWGTRETPSSASAKVSGVIERLSRTKRMFNFGTLLRSQDATALSLKKIKLVNLPDIVHFICMCCQDEILDRLDKLEANIMDTYKPQAQPDEIEKETSPTDSKSSKNKPVRIQTTTEENTEKPKWRKGKELDKEEEMFWNKLIEKYLEPYKLNNDKQQAKMKEDLKELRNKVCLFFILINALFVTIVYSLQEVNADSDGTVSIKLSCSDGGNGEAIEPISIAFTLVFGILLFIQFLCMLNHRMSTFLHVCSVTGWRPSSRSSKTTVQDEEIQQDDDAQTNSSEEVDMCEVRKTKLQKRRDLNLRKTINRKTQSHKDSSDTNGLVDGMQTNGNSNSTEMKTTAEIANITRHSKGKCANNEVSVQDEDGDERF